MPEPSVPLKNPWVAGILAFLIPGAGHLYQGRRFKAAIYSVCILGLFLTGMAMAEWQAVQPPPPGSLRGAQGTALLKYVTQAGVGLPAMYALIQRERIGSEDNVPVSEIDAPFSAQFIGETQFHNDEGVHAGEIQGTLSLAPTDGQFGGRAITGTFEGTMDGSPLSLELGPRIELARPIDGSKRRDLIATVVENQDGRLVPKGHITGSIPRPFLDWFEAPLDDDQQQDLHRRLGKYHELAMVFTWIAGLLNVLAIWDAVEGPAYGYRDEEEPEETPPAA